MSILIIRLSAIGDNVMATPLIRAFKEKYPEAEIDWLVQPESKDLVSNHPALRKVLTWPTKHFKKLAKARKYATLFKEWRAAIREIKQQQYDWVIDTQGLLKSGIIAKLSGAHYRLGCGSREGAQYMVHDNVPKIHGKPGSAPSILILRNSSDCPLTRFRWNWAFPEHPIQPHF